MTIYSKNMTAFRALTPAEQLKYLVSCTDKEKAAIVRQLNEADQSTLHDAALADPEFVEEQQRKLWGMGLAAALPGFKKDLFLAFHEDLAEVNNWETEQLDTETHHNSILSKMKLDKFGFDPFDADRPVILMLEESDKSGGHTIAAIVLDAPRNIRTPKQFTDWKVEVFRETGYVAAHLPNVYASPRDPGERLAAILVQACTTQIAEPLVKLPKAIAQAGAGSEKAGAFQAGYSFQDWITAMTLNEMGSIRAALFSTAICNPTGKTLRVLGRSQEVAWDKRMGVAASFYGRLMMEIVGGACVDDDLVVKLLNKCFAKGEDLQGYIDHFLDQMHHDHWQYLEAAKLMQEGCLLSYDMFFSPEHYPATNLFMFFGSAFWTNELAYEVIGSEFVRIPKRS